MRALLGKLVLVAFGVTLAALFAELAVLGLFGEQPKFPRRVVGSEFGLRINQPNAHYWHDSADVQVEFRINAHGMRADRDYGYRKPDCARRIVLLGDSFTIGYEVDVEDTFGAVLERDLARSGRRVEVINSGVSGYSTAEEVLYLERELYRYRPDLIVIAFYANDLTDNVRTGLFRLDGEHLQTGRESYVPAGGVGDFLNTNPIFNFLSQRSNAFVFAKERATIALKRRMARKNLDKAAQTIGNPARDAAPYRVRLTAAIYEWLYTWTRERELPLIIVSIPRELREPSRRLVDQFPLSEFDVGREGIWFVSAKMLLEPWLGRELLYWTRSHDHWTPFSHRIVGKSLAELVQAEELLGADSALCERGEP